MKHLLGFLIVCLFYFLTGLFNYLVLRYAHTAWWEWRFVRRGALFLPVFGVVSGIAWLFSFGVQPDWAEWLGIAAFGSFLVQLVLVGSLALTGVLEGMNRVITRRRKSTVPVDLLRRRIWQGGLASIPLIASGTAVVGLAGAAAEVRIPRLRLEFPDLPPDLSGQKILHISDLHLAGFISLGTLADILDRARDLSPDLIVVTGDIADDLRLLPGALKQLSDFGAPLGAYAVLGNHEYGNGVQKAHSIFKESAVPLLVDRMVSIPVGEAELCLAGMDDPVSTGKGRNLDRAAFFNSRIAKAFAPSSPGAFRLLLSHRPDAFSSAVHHGVHLTLAGHTHGGQIGFAGRSLLYSPRLYPFPWGHYQIGTSQLYTSCGAGHWVPVRLGCPAEAPLIELV